MKSSKRLAEEIAEHLLTMNYGREDSEVGDRLAIKLRDDNGDEIELGGRIRRVIVADILEHLSNEKQTHRAKSGTKLYPVRDKKGRFEDIKAYRRAHEKDLKRRGK